MSKKELLRRIEELEAKIALLEARPATTWIYPTYPYGNDSGHWPNRPWDSPWCSPTNTTGRTTSGF